MRLFLERPSLSHRLLWRLNSSISSSISTIQLHKRCSGSRAIGARWLRSSIKRKPHSRNVRSINSHSATASRTTAAARCSGSASCLLFAAVHGALSLSRRALRPCAWRFTARCSCRLVLICCRAARLSVGCSSGRNSTQSSVAQVRKQAGMTTETHWTTTTTSRRRVRAAITPRCT